MPGSLNAWYSRGDLEALATRGSELGGELPLAGMKRLAGLLHDARGSVLAKLKAGELAGGGLALDLTYEACLTLTCQRCLDPVEHRVAARVSLALVDAEPLAKRLPQQYEPLTLEDGRLKPAELIEDELIVAVPLVPRHERDDECGSLARALAAPA